MSVHLQVLLKPDRLPSRHDWQCAIDAEGIGLQLDEVDTATHEGFWPCKLDGVVCGFEYSFARAEWQHRDEPQKSKKLGWWARLFGASASPPGDEPEEPDEYDDFREKIGDRDYVAEFTWHSSRDDSRAAAFAAAILAKIADGFLFDPQDGELTSGKNAVAIVRAQDQSERDVKMALANKKWAASTKRRCPECGAPCPEYRPTCFVCDFAIGRA